MPEVEHVGRYELLMELAKGGMAELYLGRLHGVGGFTRLVAIKRILPHLAEDKLFHDMFLNEGQIAAHLSHPNICQVHELGEDDGSLFLAMEYLEGVPWDALIKQMPRNLETLRLAAGVIAQACEGLHYAHELKDIDGTPTPVIHRDVSPQNMFVTVDGVCKVLDFGVSKMMKDGPRTRTGVLKGKLPYMSPEQIQAEQLDARSDVFALGVCVWEALTGNSLFDRDTDFLIWKAITEAPVPPLAPHGMPAAIDAVIASALERDRARRFRSARALGEALRRAAETVGGAMTPSEIAEIVRSMCGDQLAQRARDVASVVSGRKSAPKIEEPSAADTIEDAPASTMNLRPGSVKVTRQPPALSSHRRWPLVLGALGALGGAVAIVLALRGGDRSSPAPPAPTPAPTPAPPPSVVPGPLTIAGEAGVDAVCSSGKTCNATCVMGGCKLRCEAGSICTADCSGGRCSSACAPGATCTFGCNGGGCTTECPDGAKCTRTCAGGGCTYKPEPTTAAKVVKAPKKPTERALVSPPAVPNEPGTFSIDSSPYATIYLDGTRLGDTPLYNAKVAAGKHQMRAVLEDGTAKTFSVEIAPGKLTNKGKLTW